MTEWKMNCLMDVSYPPNMLRRSFITRRMNTCDFSKEIYILLSREKKEDQMKMLQSIL